MQDQRQIVLFDVDGTIANLDARVHHVQGETKNWTAFFDAMDQDSLIEPVVAFYKKLWDHTDYDLVLLTGRPETHRTQTLAWLARHEIPVKMLLMRPSGDQREDDVIKEEIYRNLIKEGRQIAFVVEDRNSVVAMWRRNNVLCLQCAYGDF